MKLGSIVKACFVAGTALAKSESVLYYLGSGLDSAAIEGIDSHKALLSLADQLGVADLYPVDDDEGTFKFLNAVNNVDSSKPKLVVVINGVNEPKSFIGNHEAISIVDQKSNIEKLEDQIFKKFPKQLKSLQENFDVKKLTKELKLVYNKNSATSEDNKLITHFKYFNEELPKVWKSFKANILKLSSSTDSKVDMSMASVVSDKLFINELSQLVHLREATDSVKPEDALFIKLNSLVSLKKKTGVESDTFKFARHILAEILNDLSTEYKVTVVINTTKDSDVPSSILTKRSGEIDTLFKRESLSASSGSCYSTEEACQAGTSNCNAHGVCTKSGSKCWTCLCSPTFNNKTKKTTRWTGYDCAKKEITFEANLLLWSTLAILVAIVGGVKMLYGIGNEPLPGVLDAATAPKKNA